MPYLFSRTAQQPKGQSTPKVANLDSPTVQLSGARCAIKWTSPPLPLPQLRQLLCLNFCSSFTACVAALLIAELTRLRSHVVLRRGRTVQ